MRYHIIRADMFHLSAVNWSNIMLLGAIGLVFYMANSLGWADTAVVEQRDILLLDEWAGDQDPQFRHFFYRELLPQLRRCSAALPRHKVTVVVLQREMLAGQLHQTAD